MFTDSYDMPTEHELALAEEQRLFETIQRNQRAPRIGATYSEHATSKLMHVWQTMIDGIHESTRRITGARMSIPTTHIAELLAHDANPQAVDALQLIQYLPVVGASVQHGPIAALELINVLLSAGYRVSGDEVDAITGAFGHTINKSMTGAEWLAAGCLPMVLLDHEGARA